MYGDRGNCFDCNIAISKCVDTSGVCHYSVHFASNLFVSVLSKDDGLTQHQNREKMLRQKLFKEERRTRSHRLIVRGAVFESIVPEAKGMTNEESATFLWLALTRQTVFYI